MMAMTTSNSIKVNAGWEADIPGAATRKGGRRFVIRKPKWLIILTDTFNLVSCQNGQGCRRTAVCRVEAAIVSGSYPEGAPGSREADSRSLSIISSAPSGRTRLPPEYW